MKEISKSIGKEKLESFSIPQKDYSTRPIYKSRLHNLNLSKRLKKRDCVYLDSNNSEENYKASGSLRDHFEELISHFNNIDYSKSLEKFKTIHNDGKKFRVGSSRNISESIYKDASTSQEKGTMTDPLLSGKNKEKSNESLEINAIFKNISANNEDITADLHAKPESKLLKNHSAKSSSVLTGRTNLSLLSSDINGPEAVERLHSKQLTFMKTNKNSNSVKRSNISKSSSTDLIKECISDSAQKYDESNEQSDGTLDFKGFSNANVSRKVLPHPFPNLKDSTRLKILQHNKSGSSTDQTIMEGSSEIDHPYSHSIGTSNPKSPSKDIPNYPFMSRSVFGSPSSSKSPPDIMLHNDKINILRQMSQVFNGENSQRFPIINTDKVTNVIESSKESIVPLATFEPNCKNQEFVNNSEEIPQKVNVSLNNACTETEKIINKENQLASLVTVENEDLNLSEKVVIGLSTIAADENKTTAAPIHLVSSHSLDKEESIKVKSYIGQRGEYVDIIDGFAFASFEDEHEMNSYKDKPILKRKKRKRFGKQKAHKIIETEYKSCEISKKIKLVEESSIGVLDISNTESCVPIESEKVCNSINNLENIKDIEDSVMLRNKEFWDNEKNVEGKLRDNDLSGAFASNDLDEYLNEHSKLNVSLPISIGNGRSLTTQLPHRKMNLDELPDILKECVKLSSNNPILSEVEDNIPDALSEKLQSDNPQSDNLQSDNLQACLSQTEAVEDSNSCEDISNNLFISEKKYENSPKQNSIPDLYVKRPSKLLPLSSAPVPSNNKSEGDINPLEIIYVYHSGRLLTLGGSLLKVNPSISQNIKARIALPRGQQSLIEHSQRVSARKIKVVEINEDMAKFALSALKAPQNEDDRVHKTISLHSEDLKVENPKLSRKNILDVLTAKLSIDKRDECEPGRTPSQTSIHPGPKDGEEAIVKNLKSSKVKWNQDDILKGTSKIVCSSEQSKALRKNINRFPSLSREMKRLNMNYVQCNKDSESDENGEESVIKPCVNNFCKLGCVCDTLRCHKQLNEHCGNPECMFKCNCEEGTWKKAYYLSSVSIFNIDRKHQMSLTAKEKDFKKTIIQNGSEVIVVDSHKKKRDIRLPQRFRDSTIWNEENLSACDDDINIVSAEMKEEKIVEPSKYNKFTKPFCLQIPWYNIEGVSAWCMEHSCYDCQCFFNANSISKVNTISSESLVEEDIPDLEFDRDHINAVDEVIRPTSSLSSDSLSVTDVAENLAVDFATLKTEIIHYYIHVNEQSRLQEVNWLLKLWIHNSDIHSARTCGYQLKNKVVKHLNKPLHKDCSLPPPQFPLLMGTTLKSSKKQNLVSEQDEIFSKQNPLYKKAKFCDGLGKEIPSLHTPISFLNNNQLPIGIESSEIMEPSIEKQDRYYFNTLNFDENSTLPSSISSVESCISNIKQEGTKNHDSPIISEIKKSNRPNHHKPSTSFYELIQEEEKRGELELDLSYTFVNRKLLVTESRFRKLINMNIIGIIGLNRLGRCIIGNVSSSDDLLKMQKTHLLISNNSIDVGPNMKEIFSPSSQAEGQKVRYVMIIFNKFGNWEVVGVVQRKSDPENVIQKPKKLRQMCKLSAPSKPIISTDNLSKVSLETNMKTVTNLDLENSTEPATVHSKSEGVIINACNKYDSINYDKLSTQCATSTSNSNRDLPSKTYFLNQPSGRVFGYDTSGFNQTTSLNSIETKPTTNIISSSAMALSPPKGAYMPILPEPNLKESTRMDRICTPTVSSNPIKSCVLKLNDNSLPQGSNIEKKIIVKSPVSYLKSYSMSATQPNSSSFQKVLNCFATTSTTVASRPTPEVQSSHTINVKFSPTPNKNILSSQKISSVLLTSNCPSLFNTNITSTQNAVKLVQDKPQRITSVLLGNLGKTTMPGISPHEEGLSSFINADRSDSVLGSVQLDSPDIKCLAVTNKEYCSAIDLSIHFKSIKVHWLSGAIKRDILVHVHKVSQTNNGPISLFGTHGQKRINFFGMYKICHSDLPSLPSIPIVILGSKVSSVIKSAGLSEKELFRSNTIKYLVSGDNDQLITYTYDAKGENLIHNTSKVSNGGALFHGITSKISVKQIREKAVKDGIIKLSRPSETPEEITLSDSDEENVCQENKEINYNLDPGPLNSSPTLNELLSDCHDKGFTKQITSDHLSNSVIDFAKNNPNKKLGLVSLSESRDSVNITMNEPKHDKKTLSLSSTYFLKEPNPLKKIMHLNETEPVKDYSKSSAKETPLFIPSIGDTLLLYTPDSEEGSDLGKVNNENGGVISKLLDKNSEILDKPCLEPKKMQSKQEQQQQLYASRSASLSSKKNFQMASTIKIPLTNKKENLNGSSNSILGQEFQQIFSEAPQFWAMDAVERHNALERIRRKGLAKMFHNLFAAVKGHSPSDEKKLPPKHIVLRNAESVIQELKLEDTRLNQEEIKLRSKRMELLNQFADHLKDMDEEIQKEMELWISHNVSNPTSKEVFERLWKPSTIIFEDEPIKSSSAGDIMLKGSDITSYFEAHTSGVNSVANNSPKTSPKKKLVQRFPMYSPNRAGCFRLKLGIFNKVKKVSSSSQKSVLKNGSKMDSSKSSFSSSSSMTSSVEEDVELDERSVVPPPITDMGDKEEDDVNLSPADEPCTSSSSSCSRLRHHDDTQLSFHPL